MASAPHSRGRQQAVSGIVLVVASALTVGCGVGGPDTIEEFLDGEVPDGSSGTLVAAVDDEMVLCEGWGQSDRGASRDSDCDTVYDIMSLTKQFTAAAVMTLQTQGRLTVSDSIADHLDGVPPEKEDITIEHLLTHTSGLSESIGHDHEPLSREELVTRAMSEDPLSDPGDTYLYSNLGYSLLAAIIEETSGVGYETYLAENLFEPAGMTETGYVLPDWPEERIAMEYDEDGAAQGRPHEQPWAEDGPHWNLRGNGGLLSTAEDMFRWHVALLEEEVLDTEEKGQLFHPAVREEPDGDTYYAYGWVVADDGDLLWHNGGNTSSYGEMARVPTGEAFVFWVTNQAIGEEWDFEEDLGPAITEGTTERLLNT